MKSTSLNLDPTRRRAILEYQDKAPERQRRILGAARSDPQLRKHLERLASCAEDAICEHVSTACRVCEFHLTSVTADLRERFDAWYRALDPGPWVLLVFVFASWRRNIGQLGAFDPGRALAAAARRVSRAVNQPMCVLAADLTMNIVEGGSVHGYRYYAPHLNVLAPANQAAAIRRALASLVVVDPLTPVPVKSRSVDDPLVAFNYAVKLGASAVRSRLQRWAPQHGRYRLAGSVGRMGREEYAEFLRWRLRTPPARLLRSIGIGWRPGSVHSQAR